MTALSENLLKPLEIAYIKAADLPNGLAVMAAQCGVPVCEIEAALAWPGVSERLEAALLNAEAEGKTIVSTAQRIALKLLQRIEAQAGDVDAFDAADLIKPVQRILENADKVRLSEREAPPPLIIDISRLPGVMAALEKGRAEPLTSLPAGVSEIPSGMVTIDVDARALALELGSGGFIPTRADLVLLTGG